MAALFELPANPSAPARGSPQVNMGETRHARVTLPAAMDNGATDEDLMLRYAAGEATAFDCLYQRHRGGVYRYLLRQLRDRATAEELFQDVWLSLIRARDRYRVEARFATYLYTMAHHRLIDHYRRSGRMLSLDVLGRGGHDHEPDEALPEVEIADDDCRGPERQVLSQQQGARLVALVDKLPAAQREAFLLREEGGLSVDEIAMATGVGREAAKSRLRYAYARLQRGLRDYR